tara:strand:+ start:93 stop:482 length:390 start_codon:yes stop_codon:yes gene_type:complete
MNVLILTDRSSGAAGDVYAADRVETAMRQIGVPCNAVGVRDAFVAYEAREGKVRGYRWDDWIAHAAVTFDGFVRPYSKTLGNVNARILEKALELGKSVAYLPDDAPGVAVTSVVVTDPDNWKAGWALVC